MGMVAFQCDNVLTLRLLGVAGSIPWYPYAIHVGSHSTLLSCTVYNGIQLLQIFRIALRPISRPKD